MTTAERIGCTDHGCVFGPPVGLGTNGGCKCIMNYRLPTADRIGLERKIRASRKAAAEKLAAYKEVATYLLDEFSLGGCVYHVRDGVRDLEEGQSSWDHPEVKRFAEMVQKLEELKRDD